MSVKLKRHFTSDHASVYDSVEWKCFAVPGFPDGVEAPAKWSTNAVEIAATKFLRRRGLGAEHPHGETSIRQLVHRVVHTIRLAAEWQGYYSAESGKILEDELAYVLLHQKASFNSPVYFNLGIFPCYGIIGGGENFRFDPKSGKTEKLQSAYVHPQVSACFIQDVRDDLLSIFDLLKSEAKLFKFGSGTGTNFSRLRAKGELLEGGGESTGLLSYLEVYDKAAQAIKSGGTTRRAAKMVVLDADHPEVLDFINWKMHEERKARVLLANGYEGGMEGEAFRTVSGQNSNNSIRVTDDFLTRAMNAGPWRLLNRRHGEVVRELPAGELLKAMARAAWECADPGIQYHDTIQRWHMCPSAGAIRASNPCSEYLFLDDSACNLASLNLVSFLSDKDLHWEDFRHVVGLMLTAQEILVDYAAYPTAAIAENSGRYRPLGLGYANLGGMLMRLGVPYDSEDAALWTARVTAAMHAHALETSAEWARVRGAFGGWSADREVALEVLARHHGAWKKQNGPAWIGESFARAEKLAAESGLRNAQVSLIAPTGTIGLLMDCDTLGIEPDFALVKRKSLAGGGEMRIVNQSVPEGLRALGYSTVEIDEIVNHVKRTGGVVGTSILRQEHAAVFDCAVPPAGFPERRISVDGHLRVMAAAQPFLSGAISKTVNLPASATVDDVRDIFLKGWQLGLKAIAIYRDGSKSLQPLCAEC